MIIGFIGDRGSGKTLSAVKYMFEKCSEGHNIFANLHLQFPEKKGSGNIQKLDAKFFMDYSKSEFNVTNSVVCIDECHVFYDSRTSNLRRNRLFSRFITQSRKRNVDLIYTTQDKSPQLFLSSGQVELRLRKLTDYIVFCESVKVRGKTFILNHFCDKYGNVIFKKPFYAEPFYNLYDTNEIIDMDFENIDDGGSYKKPAKRKMFTDLPEPFREKLKKSVELKKKKGLLN